MTFINLLRKVRATLLKKFKTNLLNKSFNEVIQKSLEFNQRFYNKSLEQIPEDQKWLYEQLKIYDDKFKLILNSISRHIYNSVEIHLSSIMPLFSTLRSYASSLAALNLSVRWTSIDGAITIEQYYKAMEEKTIRLISSGKTSVKLRIPQNPKTLNKVKQCNAFVANFVQSIDASLLRVTVKMCHDYEVKNNTRLLYGAVHDCFFVNIPNYHTMLNIYKQAYTHVFAEENITRSLGSLKTPAELRAEFIKVNKKELPLNKTDELLLEQANIQYQKVISILIIPKEKRKSFLKGILKSKYLLALS